MPPKDHLQEFLKALKEELKVPKEVNPRMKRILEGRKGKLPPSVVVRLLAHGNERSGKEETWLSLAVTAYEQWEKETYPETPIP
jgi:hypothetical protein